MRISTAIVFGIYGVIAGYFVSLGLLFAIFFASALFDIKIEYVLRALPIIS